MGVSDLSNIFPVWLGQATAQLLICSVVDSLHQLAAPAPAITDNFDNPGWGNPLLWGGGVLGGDQCR